MYGCWRRWVCMFVRLLYSSADLPFRPFCIVVDIFVAVVVTVVVVVAVVADFFFSRIEEHYLTELGLWCFHLTTSH
jgi:hypothetical protein